MTPQPRDFERFLAASGLPRRVRDRIHTVAQQSGLRGEEQVDMVEELATHFHDGLASGRSVDELLESFGDGHIAGRLIATAKRGPPSRLQNRRA